MTWITRKWKQKENESKRETLKYENTWDQKVTSTIYSHPLRSTSKKQLLRIPEAQ